MVVNCAAWTAVDDAETNADAALRVNGHAVADPCGGLRRAAAHAVPGVDGLRIRRKVSRRPYGRSVILPSPRTAYGRSKLAGDLMASSNSRGRLGIRRADRLAVRGVRAELVAHHDRAGEPRLLLIDVAIDQHGQPN